MSWHPCMQPKNRTSTGSSACFAERSRERQSFLYLSLNESVGGAIMRAGVAAGCTTVMIPDGNEANEEMYRICAGVYDDLLQVKQALEKNEI